MKPEDFMDTVLDFINEFVDKIKIQVSKDGLEDLSDLLAGSEAAAFTQRMNKIYEDNKIVDEYGNVLTIQHPTNLKSRVNWTEDNIGTLEITEEEDRWFRADASYGQDIIGKLGFKYISE